MHGSVVSEPISYSLEAFHSTISVMLVDKILTREEKRLIIKLASTLGLSEDEPSQIYQAIRIEVNQEIQVLKEFLLQTTDLLVEGGRLSCISYHSLEDRLVKRFVRNGMFEGEPERDMYGRFEVPLKKVGGLIVPSDEEIQLNNRARSAKLRIAEKL